MKMTFEFSETVKYIHRIEVEISEGEEEEYEETAYVAADEIEKGSHSCDKDEIISRFNRKFGRNNVNFCEDRSPKTEFEVI